MANLLVVPNMTICRLGNPRPRPPRKALRPGFYTSGKIGGGILFSGPSIKLFQSMHSCVDFVLVIPRAMKRNPTRSWLSGGYQMQSALHTQVSYAPLNGSRQCFTPQEILVQIVDSLEDEYLACI